MGMAGFEQADQFEDWCAELAKPIRLSRGLWGRYLRGDVIPQGAREGLPHALVHRLNVHVHKSADCYYHPLWKLLDFEVMLGPVELKDMYLDLDDRYFEFTSYESKDLWEGTKVQELMFWRPPVEDDSRLEMLSDFEGIDGLAACLIEARMDFLAQKPVDFIGSLMQAARCSRAMKFPFPTPNTHRMLSVRLTIEGIFLHYGLQMLRTGPMTNEGSLDPREKLFRWCMNWNAQVQKHRLRLSHMEDKMFFRWNTPSLKQQDLFKWAPMEKQI